MAGRQVYPCHRRAYVHRHPDEGLIELAHNNILRLLSRWRSDPSVANCIEVWNALPARPAVLLPFPDQLHPGLSRALHERGIHSLYTHQEESWHHIQNGRHVAIVSGTASGKTLCYNLPVLNRLFYDPQACALYLFPTKALSQDQLAGIHSLIRDTQAAFPNLPDPHPAIYDGDTPPHVRSAIRKNARLLISNPDMLHIGILPHHTQWIEFLSRLKFIVIDEMHIYRGVFGSHVANVLRRLKRMANFYGAHPQTILTSATIANPRELAEGLIEEETVLVENDGSARGPKTFIVYNPPVIDPQLGLRRSAMQESVRLGEDLIAYDIQTIIFSPTRRSVELILTYLHDRIGSIPESPNFLNKHGVSAHQLDKKNVVRGYRSGYLPGQRREIERGLRKGDIRVVVATNALELGIDIGGMGSALIVGYPGTIAATRQQAGRAGRGEDQSLVVLVATSDPLDQFLVSHPEYLFERSPEQALINPDNPLILLDHLRCAAFELPFEVGENYGRVESSQLAEFLDFLRSQGVLHTSGNKYFWMADQYPAQSISLRNASGEPIILQTLEEEKSTLVGQIDRASAHWMVHPQAIYLHEGQTYFVDDLDLEHNIARLQPVNTDYYTEPRLDTTVELIKQLAEAQVNGADKAYGEIQVTTQVSGFRKVRWYTHELLGFGEVALPPSELITTGYWLAITEETVNRLRDQGLWSNDPNDYGPNWPRQRDLARARDSYRCQVCSAPEVARTHDVHHKTPFRAFSSPEQANRIENLITLCHSCHRRVETAVRVRSGLAGLAYLLGHLAPFFLMCDTRDLGIHSDPQSPITDRKPTMVLYDQIPAGIGFSQRLFEIHDDLISRANELVIACKCVDGCPSCVGPSGENGLGGKRETLAILQSLAVMGR